MRLQIVFALLLFGSFAGAEDYYRWTDEQGVLHFSNHHPPAGAELVELPDLPTVAPPPRAVVEEWESEHWLHPEPNVHILSEERTRYRVREE